MSKSRIRKLPLNVPAARPFRVIFPADGTSAQTLKKYALNTLKVGESVLPTPNGSQSKFNAFGKRVPLRDLPKVSRYIQTIEWKWEEFSGRGQTVERTDSRDIYRDCYQIELLPPSSLEIALIEFNNQPFYTTREMTLEADGEAQIKNAINLFLEIFGSYSLSDTSENNSAPIKSVSWKLLPAGKRPFDKLKEHLETIVGKSPRLFPVIYERQEYINSFSPKTIYVGVGGFREYVAYEFESFIVLESVKIDNAIYVFDRNWEETSKLSKKEILEANLAVARIVHSKGWKENLNELFAHSAKESKKR